MAEIIPFRSKDSHSKGQGPGKRAAQVPAPGRLKRQAKPLFFDRQEFSTLLSLYSAEVARGTWRDYAVDFLPGQALFSAYRHAHEAPVLSVSKQVQPNGRGREYLVYAGPRRLARADTLRALIPHVIEAAKKV